MVQLVPEGLLFGADRNITSETTLGDATVLVTVSGQSQRPKVLKWPNHEVIVGLIGMRLVGNSASRVIPVSKAGVLKDFYLRHRPDGMPIHDTEWSLEQIDKVVPALLREFSSRWPLTVQDKVMLAEFIAIQMVRGQRFRDWHTSFVNNYIDDLRASGELEGKQPPGMTVDEALEEARTGLATDTAVHVKMIEVSRKVAQVLGSMHWTLVEFERPWLATSDHPVFIWKLDAPSRQPRKSEDFVEGGLVRTLEARFPVSSRLALLMTWIHSDDDKAQRVTGTKDVAANINAFTIGEAEHQWFHDPGMNAPRASGQLLPLSDRLLSSYGTDVALRSPRRVETERRIQPRIGDGDLNAGFEILRVHSGGQMEIVRVAAPPTGQAASSDAA